MEHTTITDELELKQHVTDYETGWQKQQLLEGHARKIEELRTQFLKEKVISDRKCVCVYVYLN